MTANGVDGTARDMLIALVDDLRSKPGEFVYESALQTAFRARGLRAEQIDAALQYALQQRWLKHNSRDGVYVLTSDGFAESGRPQP